LNGETAARAPVVDHRRKSDSGWKPTTTTQQTGTHDDRGAGSLSLSLSLFPRLAVL
jgi:hypothetical protein